MARIFWSTERINRLSAAILVALLVSFAVTALRDHDSVSLLKRGDFPAFYSAAVIVSRGWSSQLYDADLQHQLQNFFWPSLAGEFYSYAYPPFVAALLAPLARFSPLAAKALFTGAMFVLFLGSFFLTSRIIPRLKDSLFPSFVYFLCFAPVLSGLAGGQNIALSLFLYTAAIYSLNRWNKQGEFLAGFCLGLWCFKPHYGACALLFVFLSGHFRILAGAIVPIVFYYTIAWTVSGLNWPFSWLEAAKLFADLDFQANQHQMVSIIGVSRATAEFLRANPHIPGFFPILGIVLTVILFAFAGFRFWRLRSIPDNDQRNTALIDAFFLLGPTIVLISPHTLYYDLGICLIPVVRFISLDSDRRVNQAVLLSLVLFGLTLAKPFLAVQPMALFAVFSFLLVYRRTELPNKPGDLLP